MRIWPSISSLSPTCHPLYTIWPIQGLANWSTWIARLESEFTGKWKEQGLYHFIQLTKTPIAFQQDLLAMVLHFWAPSCNSFIFARGAMSITLLDILRITRLPILRIDTPCLISTEGIPSWPRNCGNYASYSAVVDPYSTMLVTQVEHSRFVLIFKCIFCPAPGKPTLEYLPLAHYLGAGRTCGLGVTLLGSIYHFLHKSADDSPFTKLSGVTWFVQLWLFSYFPEIRVHCLSFGY